MNERIKELADQAGISTNIQTDFYEKDMNKWVDYFSEKFAQLIVQECIDIAINASSDTNFITGISEADKRALSIAVEIRNHFGVKE